MFHHHHLSLSLSRGGLLSTKVTPWVDTPHLEEQLKNKVSTFGDFPRTVDFDGLGFLFSFFLAGGAANMLGSKA